MADWIVDTHLIRERGSLSQMVSFGETSTIITVIGKAENYF